LTEVDVPDPSHGARRWRVLPAHDAPRSWAERVPLRAVNWVADAIHVAVAVLLVVIGVVVFVDTVLVLATGDAKFAERVTGAVNGVLFVIIVMEILRTVVAHFEEGGFQLKPFLIIGIISAVRHILTVGAQVSLGGDKPPDVFRKTQIELGVNAAVVLALVIGLILVRRNEVELGEENTSD
jgi:uncharacterized membrane protein (DUF373 family)